MARTFNKHLAAITSGKVTKTNIIGIRKALNHDVRRGNGWSTGSTSPKITREEVNKLYDEVVRLHPLVTGELHDTGVKLLQSPRYRKRLQAYAHITSDIDCFRLVDWVEEGNHYYPIYRAINSKGQGFDFLNMPWQAGGNGPEVWS